MNEALQMPPVRYCVFCEKPTWRENTKYTDALDREVGYQSKCQSCNTVFRIPWWTIMEEKNKVQ